MIKLSKNGEPTHPFTKLIAVLAFGVLGLAVAAAIDSQSSTTGEAVNTDESPASDS